MTRRSYLDCINAAMREEMERDPSVFLMGEDVSFNFMGSTKGLAEQFGPGRVRNTPISEAGFLGAAAGAAMVGMRPIVDMMIAPFLYPAFDQLVSIIAKSSYLYGGQTHIPVVIRAAMFYNIGTAAQHSDRPIATVMTIPGLKVVVPASPSDAKGLIKTAIRDDDPVIVFEDRSFWAESEDVPDEEYLIPFGQAAVRQAGTDVTIVGIAGGVTAALRAGERLRARGISAEVIDPRTLVPLDLDAILRSVAKTGRLVVVDICHDTCSVASHIAALVAERGFDSLRGPIVRVTTPQIPIPFSPAMERPLFPSADRVEEAAVKLVSR